MLSSEIPFALLHRREAEKPNENLIFLFRNFIAQTLMTPAKDIFIPDSPPNESLQKFYCLEKIKRRRTLCSVERQKIPKVIVFPSRSSQRKSVSILTLIYSRLSRVNTVIMTVKSGFVYNPKMCFILLRCLRAFRASLCVHSLQKTRSESESKKFASFI